MRPSGSNLSRRSLYTDLTSAGADLFRYESTDLLICCCISGVKTSPFGGVSAALGLLSFPEERRDRTFGGCSSVKLIHV